MIDLLIIWHLNWSAFQLIDLLTDKPISWLIHDLYFNWLNYLLINLLTHSINNLEYVYVT